MKNKSLPVHSNSTTTDKGLNKMQIIESKKDTFINEERSNLLNNIVNCTICNKYISLDEKNIKEHIKGKYHLIELKFIINSAISFSYKNESTIRKSDNYKEYLNNHFVCHICNMLFYCNKEIINKHCYC